MFSNHVASSKMRKEKRRFIIFLVSVLLLTGVLGILFWPLIKNLNSSEYRELFSAWVTGLGFSGVLILFCIQALQVVIAVIPGQPVALIAGAAYGAWHGLLILMAGGGAATLLVFFLVRKFGLPLVRRFINVDDINTWCFLSDEKKSAMVIFILFLIPGIPKDTLTYLAPLSRLSIFTFTKLSMLARFPALLMTTIMGDAAIQGNLALFLLVFAITAALGILGIQFKNRIANWSRDSQPNNR